MQYSKDTFTGKKSEWLKYFSVSTHIPFFSIWKVLGIRTWIWIIRDVSYELDPNMRRKKLLMLKVELI